MPVERDMANTFAEEYRRAVNEAWRRPESEVELQDILRRMNRTRPYDRMAKGKTMGRGRQGRNMSRRFIPAASLGYLAAFAAVVALGWLLWLAMGWGR